MKALITLSAWLLGSLLLSGNTPSVQTHFISPNAGHSILAVFAHPDDEICVSPLLARYAREGVKVYLAIATNGQQGVMPHAHIPAGDSLGKVRSEEARCAAQALHIEPPILLGMQDGQLSVAANMPVLHKKLDSLFTALQPDVVITWGPDGGYGHADHRMVSDLVTEVFQQGGNGWPKQLYYAGISEAALKDPPPFKTFAGIWLSKNLHPTKEQFLPYRIAYKDEDLQAARTSYACHKSQWTPDAVKEIFILLGRAGKTVYLRPWFGGGKIKTDVFEY